MVSESRTISDPSSPDIFTGDPKEKCAMQAKILIVEDHDDFRAIVRQHLESQDLDMEILEASSGELGISKALRFQPHIILMDLRLPGMSGIEAAGRIKQLLPHIEILILTMFETTAFQEVFKSDDVSAYIGKSELFERLVPEIKKSFRRMKKMSRQVDAS